MPTRTGRTKSTVKEGTFKKRLIRALEQIPNSSWIVTEAGSVRGHADIKGSINGYAVSLEVKRCKAESRRQTGRTVLQRYKLQQAREAGEYANWCYPENLEETLADLRHFNSLLRASPLFSLPDL